MSRCRHNSDHEEPPIDYHSEPRFRSRRNSDRLPHRPDFFYAGPPPEFYAGYSPYPGPSPPPPLPHSPPPNPFRTRYPSHCRSRPGYPRNGPLPPQPPPSPHYPPANYHHISFIHRTLTLALDGIRPSHPISCYECSKSLRISNTHDEPLLKPAGEEEMSILPCGHIVGSSCWAERQRSRQSGQGSSCPVCHIVTTSHYKCGHETQPITTNERPWAMMPPMLGEGGKVAEQCLPCTVKKLGQQKEAVLLDVAEKTGIRVQKLREAAMAAGPGERYLVGTQKRKADKERAWRALRYGLQDDRMVSELRRAGSVTKDIGDRYMRRMMEEW